MEDFIDTISIHLIQKALFDREVHIRRAASAAYQEMVGRTVSYSTFTYFITAQISKRISSNMVLTSYAP